MKKKKLIRINLFSARRKLNKIKTSISPNKIFYIWDKNYLTKVETFSLE